MRLAIHKYHGLGNDFVLVEGVSDSIVSAELARALCDRRFGVGADGVLVLLPARSRDALASLRVINADGTVPEMCGNGLRCAVLHVARARKQEGGAVTIDTDAGIRSCVVDDRHGYGLVTIDMGIVKVTGEVRLDVDGDEWPLTLADAGNPHAITTRAATPEIVDSVGPKLARHAHFPAGTNVEFATFKDREIDLVVWERGVGRTFACGTGASAAAAVGVEKGVLPRDEEITVNLPGGTLFVSVHTEGHTIMRGPARHVFSGHVAPEIVQSARIDPR